MQTKFMERYFFFGILFITLILTFFIFKPFWITLLLGASFAIVLMPIQKWFKNHKLSNWFSSFLTVLIFLLLICGPLFLVGVMVFNQSQNVYHFILDGNKISPFVDNLNYSITKYLPNGITFDFNQKASDFISILTSNIATIFSTTISTIFSFILMIIAIFYFLKNGSDWKKAIITLSPMSDSDDQKIINRLKETIEGVIKGNVLIAFLQGILMGIGLAIFGVPNAALWGVIAALASFMPTFGTALISIPAIIFLYVGGHIAEAIGMLIWAGLLIGLLDNFLSPIIVSKKTKLPEFIVLFAVLGGIALFGPVGVLVGPITIGLLYTLISIYRNEFKN